MAQGLLRVVSGDKVAERERQAALDMQQAEPFNLSLAAHLRRLWSDARDTRRKGGEKSVESTLVAALRAKQGTYSPQKLGEIRRFGGSEVYARVIAAKARTAYAWLRDVYLGGNNEKPWSLSATPEPTLQKTLAEVVKQLSLAQAEMLNAQGVQVDEQLISQLTDELWNEAKEMQDQQAADAARGMEEKIEDQLREGGFYEAFAEFLDDLTLFKCAYLKGPVVRQQLTLNYAGDGKPTVVRQVGYQFDRIDPFSVYPLAWSIVPDDGFFILHSMTRKQVDDLRGSPGFNEAALSEILTRYDVGMYQDWSETDYITTTVRALEKRDFDPMNVRGTMQVLEFQGWIDGKLLLDWGIEPGQVPDPARQYAATAWLIDRWVVKARLNPHPLGRTNLYKASFEQVPGAWWGNGIYDLVGHCEETCNATLRALVNNVAISSGPQVVVNVNRLSEDEPLTTLYPWKYWKVDDDPISGSSNRAPVEFFQPKPSVEPLLATFERFYVLADDLSMIPRYMQGNEKLGTLGRTSSGLAMVMGAAQKGLQGVVSGIDLDLFEPIIRNMFELNMLFEPDPKIKGDIRILPKGVMVLMQKDALQVRQREFLATVSNPIDMQIVGLRGRAKLLQELGRGLGLPVNDIVPDPDKLPPGGMPMPGQGSPGQGGPPGPGGPTSGGGQYLPNFAGRQAEGTMAPRPGRGEG